MLNIVFKDWVRLKYNYGAKSLEEIRYNGIQYRLRKTTAIHESKSDESLPWKSN